MRRAATSAMAFAAATMGCHATQDGPDEKPISTWERDIAPIVGRAACAACHQDGDSDEDGMLDDFDDDGVPDVVPNLPYLDVDPLDALIGVPSNQALEMALVEPGDHLYSYFWHKVNGSQSLAGGSGTSMPLGGTLTGSDIQRIADWIDEGAAP